MQSHCSHVSSSALRCRKVFIETTATSSSRCYIFEDLRIDGHTFPTFKQMAKQLGLLEDDEEWCKCLVEASRLQMPAQIFNSPTDECGLFEEFAHRTNSSTAIELTLTTQNYLMQTDIHIFVFMISINDSGITATSQMIWDSAPHDLPSEEQINVIEEQQLGAQM